MSECLQLCKGQAAQLGAGAELKGIPPGSSVLSSSGCSQEQTGQADKAQPPAWPWHCMNWGAESDKNPAQEQLRRLGSGISMLWSSPAHIPCI
jgi:hypothetical protein